MTDLATENWGIAMAIKVSAEPSADAIILASPGGIAQVALRGQAPAWNSTTGLSSPASRATSGADTDEGHVALVVGTEQAASRLYD